MILRKILESGRVFKKINAYQLQPAVLTPLIKVLPLYEQFNEEGRILIKDL